MKQLCMLLIILALSTPVYASQGATCMIRAGGKLILVKEMITGKLSLPGGIIEAGEHPQDAAEREAWEEIGLTVKAGKLLYRAGNSFVYQCRIQDSLYAFRQTNNDGFHPIPSWWSPSYGLEIQKVYLVTPSQIAAQWTRYPDGWQAVMRVFPTLAEQPVLYIDEDIERAPRWQQANFRYIKSLQRIETLFPDWLAEIWKSFAMLMNILGSELFMFLSLLVIYAYWGAPLAQRFLFAILVSGGVGYGLQLWIALPPPSAYVPSLAIGDTTELSLPCISAVWSALCFGWFAQIFKHNDDWHPAVLSLAGLTVACGQLISLSWSGEYFITDIISGYVIGGCIAIIISPLYRVQIFSRIWLWWAITAILAGLVWLTLSSYLIRLFSVALTASVVYALSAKYYPAETSLIENIISDTDLSSSGPRKHSQPRERGKVFILFFTLYFLILLAISGFQYLVSAHASYAILISGIIESIFVAILFSPYCFQRKQ